MGATISRYNGKNDILFGATVWQRPTELAGVESMVGLVINTLPVRIQFSANDLLIPSLQKWQVQQIQRRAICLYATARYSALE